MTSNKVRLLIFSFLVIASSASAKQCRYDGKKYDLDSTWDDAILRQRFACTLKSDSKKLVVVSVGCVVGDASNRFIPNGTAARIEDTFYYCSRQPTEKRLFQLFLNAFCLLDDKKILLFSKGDSKSGVRYECKLEERRTVLVAIGCVHDNVIYEAEQTRPDDSGAKLKCIRSEKQWRWEVAAISTVTASVQVSAVSLSSGTCVDYHPTCAFLSKYCKYARSKSCCLQTRSDFYSVVGLASKFSSRAALTASSRADVECCPECNECTQQFADDYYTTIVYALCPKTCNVCKGKRDKVLRFKRGVYYGM